MAFWVRLAMRVYIVVVVGVCGVVSVADVV